MKAVMLLSGLLAALGSVAQDGRYDWKSIPQNDVLLEKQLKPTVRDTFPLFKMDSLAKGRTINLSVIMDKRRYLGESAYGPVYALPQDNMPCIMPALAGRGMPNGATPKALQEPIDPGIYIPSRPYDKGFKIMQPPAINSK